MKTWGWLAAVIDVVLIVLFALIGRSSHGETVTAGGIWLTAYPFLAGWAIAYVTSGAWVRPLRLWPTGVVAWILTDFVGMAIRVATGQGVDHGDPLPLSFLIVATVVLGLFLVGWRAIAGPIVRRVAGPVGTGQGTGGTAAPAAPVAGAAGTGGAAASVTGAATGSAEPAADEPAPDAVAGEPTVGPGAARPGESDRP